MPKITYKNENAVLSFEFGDMIEYLSHHIKEHNVEDDSMLLEWLEDRSGKGKLDITINTEDDQEKEDYPDRIVYTIRDLLLAEKGDVYCKWCDRHISVTDIKKDQTTPFDAHKGINRKTIKGLKKEFGLKGRVRLPGSGGTAFFCDKGHELFGTRDWMT